MSVAIISSALIIVLCCSCATEVQAVDVAPVGAGVFNTQQDDGGYLAMPCIRCRKEVSLEHIQGEISPSISPTTSSGNCSACPPWHHHSPSASGSDTVCTCGHSLGGVVECDDQSNELYVHICYCHCASSALWLSYVKLATIIY